MMFKNLLKYLFCLTLICNISCFAKKYKRFDIVGDSISANFNPQHTDFGWAKMLFGEGFNGNGTMIPPKSKTIYSLWPKITVANHAVAGSKASDWATDGFSGMINVTSGLPDLVVVYNVIL